jgi:homoserine O-acetyltransferase
LDEPFHTCLGQQIDDVQVMVEQHGSHTLPPSRTVVIFPSFSHSSHVARNLDDQSPGWWENIVGPGKAIDTNHWRVICCSLLGSPYSQTTTTAINRRTGRQYRRGFPTVTPTDLARCHEAVLRHLGVDGQLHAVVGSSLGGMQALQFASLYPERAARVLAIAATGRTTPFTVGIRHMQRKAILWDPEYHDGDYADHGTVPAKGLQIAREMGTLFYRSREEFDARFNWAPFGDRNFTALDTWEVETYLNYAGARFVRRFDANAYLLLSKCMDLMDLGDGYSGRLSYAQGAARIVAETLLIGVKQDALIPMQELRCLAELINTAHAGDGGDGGEMEWSASRGCWQKQPPLSSGSGAEGEAGERSPASNSASSAPAAVAGSSGSHESAPVDHAGQRRNLATFLEMDSPFGHDAFLKEADWLTPRIRPFLERGLEAQLEAERLHNTGHNAP